MDNLYSYNRPGGPSSNAGGNGVSDIETLATDYSNGKMDAANGGQMGTINPANGNFTALQNSTGFNDIDNC